MSNRSVPFGITGATGEIGRRVAAGVSGRELRQRLIVRNRSQASQLPGAEVVEAPAYGDRDAMQRALESVETLFFVSGRETHDRLDQHRTAIDAAVAAGVERFVYLSFLAAAPNATFTLAQQHFHTEQHIRSKGVRFTFLRPSLYLDSVPRWAGSEGVLRGPAGNGRTARVARDDIADVAVAVLTGSGHDGQTYDVTGPEAQTMAEIAEIASRVIGRPIRYEEETIEEAWESRRPTGAPDWEIEGWITSYAAIATGEMDIASDTVQRVAGHEPEGLEHWLRRHPESWKHLVIE